MCHLWPAVAPHGPEVPTSVWNLGFGTWHLFAAAADAHIADLKRQQKEGG